MRLPLIAAVVSVVALRSFAAPIQTPSVNDSRLEISLFAAEPDIVTPIGIAASRDGKLFVVESHTHFPKPDYPGPKSDRVKIFHDDDHDGRPERITIFAEGFKKSMNLAFSPEGELYLVHRNGVLILHDRDHDGVSEAQTTVLEMDTPGDYPHNGLGGIAFSTDGWLYIGMGENLGAKYTLKGKDGSSHSGGGEGGNVFRCRPDGTHLEQVATGFWNAFALQFNRAGYLFCVDNDPDSRPPCRLIDVVMGGDYGYKFRYGRSGLHPFTAWNGELPGTLPMVAGTGEAPSGILNCDNARLPSSYEGALLATSWGDHAIEVYRPKPFGASVRAEREVLVQGDENFRPVAITSTPDGTIFFTDWVDRDYSVHGKGRIWRLAPKSGIEASIASAHSKSPAPSPERRRMQDLLQADFPKLTRALHDSDPFIRSTAVYALSKPAFREQALAGLSNSSAQVRLGCLLALRRACATLSKEQFSRFLQDNDEQIRQIALIWIGETKRIELAPELDKVAQGQKLSPALFRILLAAKNAIAEKSAVVSDNKIRTFSLANPADPKSAAATLKDHKAPYVVRLEALRTLAEVGAEPALLRSVALDPKNETNLRAEAICALSTQPANFLEKMLPLLKDPEPVIQREAIRCLRPAATDPRISSALNGRSVLSPVRRDAAARAELLKPGGDPESGRRLFFHASVGCARCHRIEDHGGFIGPDLSVIARAGDRKKILESVLEPSKEIAPQFATHNIETKDGQSFSGLLSGEDKDGSVTLTMTDGNGVFIPGPLISSHTISKTSLMPEGLDQGMTTEDLRDLIAFLATRK